MINSVAGSAMDMPGTYRICITGHVDSQWANRLWGMQSESIEEEGEPPQSTLVGRLADQAALMGVINALYNRGHAVVSVVKIAETPSPAESEATEPEGSQSRPEEQD